MASSSESPPLYTHNRCISCGSEETAARVCSDEQFKKLMKFFWDGLSVDVKPLDSFNHEFCEPCTSKIMEFYDTNQVLLQLEKHLWSVQKSLIKTCVQGIEKLKQDGHPLLPVHKNLFEQWGSGSEEGDEKEEADGDQAVETFLEEGLKEEEVAPAPAPKKASPPKKRSPTKAGRRRSSKKVNEEESSDYETSTSEESENLSSE